MDKAAGEQAGLRRDRCTPEQVFNVKLTKVLHGDTATGQIGQTRQSAGVHGQRVQALDDFVAPVAAGAGQSQQDVGDCKFLDERMDFCCGEYG